MQLMGDTSPLEEADLGELDTAAMFKTSSRGDKGAAVKDDDDDDDEEVLVVNKETGLACCVCRC
jgi:hypothetical protein